MADPRNPKSKPLDTRPGDRKPVEGVIDLANAHFAAIREELDRKAPREAEIKELCNNAQALYSKAKRMAEESNDKTALCEALVGIGRTFNAQGNTERANIFFVAAYQADSNKYQEVRNTLKSNVTRGGAPASLYEIPMNPATKDQKLKTQIIDNYDPNKPVLPSRKS